MHRDFKELNIKVDDKKFYTDLSNTELIEKAVSLGQGKLSSAGSLVVDTGDFTGRAAQDRYVVESEETKKKIWWNKAVRPMSKEVFDLVKEQAVAEINRASQLFYTYKAVGLSDIYSLGVQVISPSATHTLFCNYLFRNVGPKLHKEFTILHAPGLLVDSKKLNTRSGTVIVTNFEEEIIIVCGTFYAGEIKKSMFSIMNYLLPDEGILPMHAGVNMTPAGSTSIFFGLSGTGKTTLSTDVGTKLIGDDEHGLQDAGVFNFEGGCYAKMIKLSEKSEPGIYRACNRFGALLENVVMNDENRAVDFDDGSRTENTRGSYPLSFITDYVESAKGPVPKDIFFLSADAFGVLPPVAKLDKNQAMYYFISGYTAKLAGTEIGVKEPQATFSVCFGGPFMLRSPEVYGNLLMEYIEKFNINVWLINTGWTGGPEGVGHRFPLDITRGIIRSIQKGWPNTVEFEQDAIFGFNIPTQVPDCPALEQTNPRDTWHDKNHYDVVAKKLANMFKENFKKFEKVSEEVTKAGPL